MPNVPQSITELGLTSYNTFLGYSDIKSYLLTQLKSLPNWVDIDKTFTGSGTLELILHLISLSHEITSFMNLRGVQESYIEFAQISENIYAKARELGYRINRPNAPAFTVEYLGLTTLTISSGTVFGTYDKYDLVYYNTDGLSIQIEQGDIIPCFLGKFKEQSFSFDPKSSSATALINIINPTTLNSIDNININLIYNSSPSVKTLFPEDYIVFEKYADFSESLNSAKIFVADFVLTHGLSKVLKNNIPRSYLIQYLETDGNTIATNGLTLNSFVMTKDYRLVSYDSIGTSGDTPSSIVANAPLVYSILRRAITESDFVFLLRSNQYIKNVSVTTYGDLQGIYEITYASLSPNNFISINSLVYSYQNLTNLPANTVIKILYQQLRNDNNITPQLIDTAGVLSIKLFTKSSRIPINLAVSPNLISNILQAQILAKPCILHIRYVGHNTKTTPIPLSYIEYTNVNTFIDYYKSVGLTLYYEHASVNNIVLNYSISLVSSVDKILVDTLIKQVIDSYNYSMDSLIDSNSILKTIELYINQKYSVGVILYTIDSTPISTYIDKSHYCHIDYNINYV